MLHLLIILHLFIGATLAGVGIVIALVAGFTGAWPLILSVVVGFAIAFPVSWLIARKLRENG